MKQLQHTLASLRICYWSMSYLGVIRSRIFGELLRSGKSLKKLGGMQEQMAEVVSEATKFLAACYGYPREDNLSGMQFGRIRWLTSSSTPRQISRFFHQHQRHLKSMCMEPTYRRLYGDVLWMLIHQPSILSTMVGL